MLKKNLIKNGQVKIKMRLDINSKMTFVTFQS